MEVSIKAATRNPLNVISSAAGCCYGKTNYSEKRVRRCINNGHESVLEHVVVTFKIEGISRACLAQLTRHRIASYSVKSQRYVKENNFGMVIPKTVAKNDILQDSYEQLIIYIEDLYSKMIEAGVPAEDARYILPNATCTDLYLTMNLRELFHFWDLRLSNQAQWEIRELAEKMMEMVFRISDSYSLIVEMYHDRDRAEAHEQLDRELEDQNYAWHDGYDQGFNEGYVNASADAALVLSELVKNKVK